MNMKRLLIYTLPLWLLLLAAACGDGKAGEGGKTAVKPPVAVETAAATTSDVRETVDFVGSLAPKFSADVKSQVLAVVAEVYVTEWVEVKKGTPLARLDTREEEAAIEGMKAAVLQAKVAETRSLRELERSNKLKEAGLITQQGWDDARTARDAAAASTKAAEAQLKAAQAHLSKSTILAPMDGVISYRGVSPGDRVETIGGDAVMFKIVDNRNLDLTVQVPSVKMASLKLGQPLSFSVDSLPGREFTGTVMFINPSLDSQSRTAKVVAEVKNRDGELRGGLFVKGKILTGIRQNVLRVPRSALFNWNMAEASADVFLVRGEVCELRKVQTGALFGDYVEIASGLSAGERVVTRGGFNLRNGDRVRVAAAEG